MRYTELARVSVAAVATGFLTLVACGEGSKDIEPAVGPGREIRAVVS